MIKSKALALVAALLLLAASCGSDAPSVAESANESEQAQPETPEPEATEPEATEPPEPTSTPAPAATATAEPTATPPEAEPPGGFPIVNELEADFLQRFNSAEVAVLDSTIHYVSSGEASSHAVVLLHGQPTSSFLWREVMPHLADDGYVVAPDLIGMGRSGRPDIGYTLGDHVDYLDGFLNALGIESAVLVMHDVGGLTGVSWAAQNPEAVTGVVLMETAFAPVASLDQITVPGFSELLAVVRDPNVDEEFVYQSFVEDLLQTATIVELSDDVMDVYRAPWLEPGNRAAMVAWPQQLPIGGEPAEANALLTAGFGWVTTAEIPSLLIHADPGFLMATPIVELSQALIPTLETTSAGAGIHYLQEDVPDEIGTQLSDWLQANGLAG